MVIAQNCLTFLSVLRPSNSGEVCNNIDVSLESVSSGSIGSNSANLVSKSSPILLNAVKREVSEEVVEHDSVKGRHDSSKFKVDTEANSHVTSSTPAINTRRKAATPNGSNDGNASKGNSLTQKHTLGMYSF